MTRRTVLKGLLALPALAYGAEPKTLRIGFQKGGLLLVKTRGVLEPLLAAQGWQLKWIEFPAGPALLEALNVGAIDFGVTGAPPPVFAQAAGTQFVYVGAEPGAPGTEAILVKPESPMRSVADLKGKRIGLAKGSSSHYLLIRALTLAGLRYADIQPVFLPPADARAAFQGGSIDAWVVWDPYLTIAQSATQARLLSAPGLDTGAPWSFYEARREFTQANPAIVRALVGWLGEAGAWANSHQAEAARILAPLLGLDEALALKLQQRQHYGAVPTNAVIAASQQAVADAFFELKLIPRAVQVRENFWPPLG